MSERLVAFPSREPEKPDVSGLASDLGQAALLLAAETVDSVSVNASAHQAPAADRDQALPSEVRDEIIPPRRRTQFTRYNNPNTGQPLSDETKAKISQANKGKKHSPESRARMSEAHKDKKHSDETKAKISQAKKGQRLSDECKAELSEMNKGEKNPSYGKKSSDETRAKLSEANKGEKNPNFGRKHSDETKAKISQAKKGQRHTEETKAKLSRAQTGQRHTEETKAKLSAINKGQRLSDGHKAKISTTQKARHAAIRAAAKPLWRETMTREEKLTALLPRLGSIERQIVVRSWGRDGHAPQSVDEITQQLFQGMPVWRAKVQGTIQAVQRLVSSLEYPSQLLDNDRSQTSQGADKPNQP